MPGVKGRSGRKPKPTALKELEGTARPDRANPNEPKPKPGTPSMPDYWIGPKFAEARREWRRVIRDSAPGMLTKADRSMLELYCQLMAGARKSLERGILPRPAMITQIRALASEFGLMPSSRSRMSVPAPKEEDPFMEWLNGNQRN